jgi:hypothetical protein
MQGKVTPGNVYVLQLFHLLIMPDTASLHMHVHTYMYVYGCVPINKAVFL